jgi:hypothetical protein
MKQTIRRCEVEECKRSPEQFRIWKSDQDFCIRVDLCKEHAKPIAELMKTGETEELPVKKRMKMEVTKLKTTKRTAALKKKKTPAKPKSD